MALKNYIIFSLLLIMLMPLAFAEITVTPIIRDLFNLGDTIPASAFITQIEHLQGLLKLTISCGDYALTYSVTPLILESGVERKVEAPLTLIGQMTGECEIIADYDSIASSFTEEERSNSFMATTSLLVNAVLEKQDFLPQEEMIVAGTVTRNSGDYVGNETVTLNFQDKDYKTEVKDGRFIYKIEVLASTRSGEQELLFLVTDKNGNIGELTGKITITAIPSRLGFKINKKSFNPQETIEIMPYLYDQSDSPIEREVKIEMVNSKKKTVIDENVLTNKAFNYKLEQQAIPGEYTFKISKDKLSKEDSIIVNEVKDLSINLEGNVVYIANIGNVEYKDTTTILLEGGEKKYALTKKVDLDPGESMEIDLSTEVKEDNYDVIITTGEETAAEVAAESEEEVSEATVSETSEREVIENVKIEDNRGIVKKATQGMGDITGFAVTPIEGENTSKSSWALWVIIAIVVLVIGYYNRGLLKQKAKPEEETIVLDAPKTEESEPVSEFEKREDL